MFLSVQGVLTTRPDWVVLGAVSASGPASSADVRGATILVTSVVRKGKGDNEALDRGYYRGLELTDQVMKLLEWVLYKTSSSVRWWISMRCSSALCLSEVPLTPSSLIASCRRSTSQLRNYSTLPSSTLKKIRLSCTNPSMNLFKVRSCNDFLPDSAPYQWIPVAFTDGPF